MSKLIINFSAHREVNTVYLRLNGTSYALGDQDALDLAQLLTDLTAGIQRPQQSPERYTVNFGLSE